jgi:hypothetical protein
VLRQLRIQLTLQREVRVGREVLRTVFEVVTTRERHTGHVRLAAGHSREGQTDAGHAQTLPPARHPHDRSPAQFRWFIISPRRDDAL